jgi:hypothetical protein
MQARAGYPNGGDVHGGAVVGQLANGPIGSARVEHD